MLSDAELQQMLADAERIEALREKATPGPWEVFSDGAMNGGTYGIDSCSCHKSPVLYGETHDEGIAEEPDASFIAATRTDPSAANVLRLVDEVRRLRAALSTTSPHPTTFHGYHSAKWMDDFRDSDIRRVVAMAIEGACHIHGVEVPEHLKAYEEGGAK